MEPEQYTAIVAELAEKFTDLTHHEVGVILSNLGQLRKLFAFVVSREEFEHAAWAIGAEQWWELLEDHRKGRTAELLIDALTTYVVNMDRDEEVVEQMTHEEAREALKGDVTSDLRLTDYTPNVTCPYCRQDTSPTYGNEMHWEGNTLTIQQTCRECGHRWNEEWELRQLRAIEEDELPPSKW